MPRGPTIVQFPNPPLLVAWTARAVARRTSGTARRRAALLSRVALLLWAYQELLYGVNWFRRVLGATVGARTLRELVPAMRRRSAPLRHG